MKNGLGWRPDKPDARDHRFGLSLKRPLALPPRVFLGEFLPTSYPLDQGDTNSCVGHGIAEALVYTYRKMGLDDEGEADWLPSPAFLYALARIQGDCLDEDGGAEIRDGIKALVKYGACASEDWPLKTSTILMPPPARCYAAAKKHVVTRYSKVDHNLSSIRQCLAVGNPIVFGMMLFPAAESDEVAETGALPMPKGSAIGGHCVCLMGYDDATSSAIVLNHWGKWGQPQRPGFFTMPYDYLVSEQCSDFWTIQAVGAAQT